MTSKIPVRVAEQAIQIYQKLEYYRGNREFILVISNEYKYKYYISLGSDVYGNIQRIDNCLDKIAEELAPTKSQLENEKIQLKNAEIEAQKEFTQELELVHIDKTIANKGNYMTYPTVESTLDHWKNILNIQI